MVKETRAVALVTGGSRGIGRGIAVELARRGFSVAINYAGNAEAAEETRAACVEAARQGEHPGMPAAEFAPFQADVGRPEDRTRLVREVWEHFGTVDVLVNNAGIGPRERLDIVDATEESFREVLEVNLAGAYFLTQAIVRRWLGRDGGAPDTPLESGRKVVFVSSISAETASINRGEYCISKAGLSMASKLWAVRLAAENAQVYEIRPGIVETDLTRGVKGKYDALIGDGLVPQKRWGKPEDLGKLVGAIAQGDLAFSTGAVIYSDGGFNISRL
ncbi:MAG: 3-ketoacyl-ACP reductase [Spirochaetaceae bacterium]|nr:MAG: 3-ketoacyl-ACP reductase [Spirochaetaceae bacterium]